MSAIQEIAAERRRQIEAEGWSEKHDDKHGLGELAVAAACYTRGTKWFGAEYVWPWSDTWWKPKDRRRNLVRAGALIVAEIERLDRIDARAEKYLAPATEE